MPDYPGYHVLGAFVLGIALAAAYRDWSAKAHSNDETTQTLLTRQRRLLTDLAEIRDIETVQKRLAEFESALQHGVGSIKTGIEGCIGDTPLIKIKSLSEATGCEILAKAEVTFSHRRE